MKGQTSNVKIIIYSSLGKEVAALINEKQDAGYYDVEFNPGNFSSGIYFYTLNIDGMVIDIKRLVLLK